MEFGPKAVHDADKGIFGASIGRSMAGGEFAGSTGHCHNMPTFVLDHMLDKTLDMPEWPMDIHILQCEMILKTIVLKQASHRDPRILHHNV